MNKTVTINLGGIVFHIEEQAYDKLGKYLNTIKGYFNDSDGRDEIIADIESRIAEIFQGNVTEFRQVIVLKNVDDAIDIMGKPEDFANSEKSESDEQQNKKSENKNREENTQDSSKRKRVFRDPDERVLGGVCSGIAAHFDFDPIWLRIGFAIAFFGFGVGFPIYILLWIVIPSAKTTAEKLEMRGENVNVENIKNTVHEEMENLKKKMNDLKNEIGSKDNKDKFTRATNKFSDLFVQFFGSLFRIVGKIILIFILVIGLIILFSFFAGMFGFHSFHTGFNSYSLREIGNIVFNTETFTHLATLGFIFLIGIPVLSIIYKIIRILFGIKEKNKYVKYTFASLWFTGLVLLCYVFINSVDDFNESADYSTTEVITQPKNQVLYLKTLKDNYFYKNSESSHYTYRFNNAWIESKGNNMEMFSVEDSNIITGAPNLSIIPSENDSFYLEITYSAHGSTKKEALRKAQNIHYAFSQTDSILEFNKYYQFSKDDRWRNQDVSLELRVPVNKIIYLDKSLDGLIYDVKNTTNTYDYDMLGRRWVMTVGELKCLDCKGLRIRKSDEEHSDDFTKIDVSDAITVHLKIGDKNSVRVEGDKEVTQDIKTEIENHTLKIFSNDDKWFATHKKVEVFVEAIEIKQIVLSGASELDSKTPITGNKLTLDVSGASSLHIGANVDEIKSDVVGASSVTISGTVQKINSDVVGASNLKCFDLETENAIIDAVGASEVEINVTEKLKAHAVGASKIKYKGSPKKTDFDQEFSSSISGK